MMAQLAENPAIHSYYTEDSTYARGRRDVFIVGSIGDVFGPSVVPREKVELKEEDWRRLTSQGIPPEHQTDELSVIRARIGLDKDKELVGVEVSKPGRELTRGYVLKQLESVLTNCKKEGVVIYYFGHGKKNTGDWCFQDGFITFRDIADLYSNHFRGHPLAIVSDCSHSGRWVMDCGQYLKEKGVQPCGHSSTEEKFLFKVFASCSLGELAGSLCFVVRGIVNNKNNGKMWYFHHDREVRKEQHLLFVDFTELKCGKPIECPCTLIPDYTWQRWSEAHRLSLVRGRIRGQPAWWYVLLVNDEETIKMYKEKTRSGGNISLDDYGQVLKSGMGKELPNEVKDWIDRTYFSPDYS